MSPGTDGAAPCGAGNAMNPLEALRHLAPAQAARYNTAALQRKRILHRLSEGPATRPELERASGAPSVTKRISELRRDGWHIAGQWIEATAPDGRLNAQTLYSLADDDTAQGDLFNPA